MEKSSLIREVKQLIGEAELEAALDKLAAFLEKDDRYAGLGRTALHLRAEYRKTARDETRGVLSREDAKLSYNQLTDKLLSLLDDLEEGRTGSSIAGKRKKGLPLIAAGALAVLLIGGFFGYRYFAQPSATAEFVEEGVKACPDFGAGKRFNILLLPFFDYRKQDLAAHHVAIGQSLIDFCRQQQIKASARIYQLDPTDYPIDDARVAAIGEDCKDARLLIWGTAEAESEDEQIVQARYRFLNLGEKFAFAKLQYAGDSSIDTVRSISSIATEGALTAGIRQSILLLFGLIAHETQNFDASIAALEASDVQAIPDSSTQLLRGMMLADNYLAKKDSAKALTAYDEVLEMHPNYSFARNNRALLLFRKGDYEAAAEDLSVHLGNKPEDTQARIARSAAYLKAEQLDKAKADLEEAKKSGAKDQLIRKQEIELKEKIREQKSIKTKAEERLRLDPDNVQALQAQAEASRKLGEYDDASEAARRILERDPGNAEAYRTLFQTYQAAGQYDKLKEAASAARRSGVAPEVLSVLPQTQSRTLADSLNVRN